MELIPKGQIYLLVQCGSNDYDQFSWHVLFCYTKICLQLIYRLSPPIQRSINNHMGVYGGRRNEG